MLSNGVVHIGNDTFVAVTRDCSSHIFLITSSFPKAERVVPLRLTRRVLITPNASLNYDPVEVERFITSYRKYSEQNGKDTRVNMIIPSKVSGKEPHLHSLEIEQGRASDGADHKTVTLKPPDLKLPESPQEVMDATKDTDWISFLRYSLHVSPDAHIIAAISNTSHRHYIINIGESTDIIPFETFEAIRSICWHHARPYLLLLLSVSGVFMVFDTTAPSFHFMSRCMYYVSLKSLIHGVLERKLSQSLPIKSIGESTSLTEASKLSHTFVVKELNGPIAKKGGAGKSAVVSNDSPRSLSKVRRASMLINDLGMPTKGIDNDAASGKSKKQLSSSRAGLLRGVQEVRRSGQSVLQRPFAKSSVGPNHSEVSPKSLSRRSHLPVKVTTAAASTSVQQVSRSFKEATVRKGPNTMRLAPTPSDSSIQSLPSKGCGSFQRTRAASVVSPSSSICSASREMGLRENSVAGLSTICEDSPNFSEPPVLEFVDICCVRPTRGLPTTLLMLCRDGEVWAVKLDSLGGLAMGAEASQDGRVPLNATEVEAARQRAAEVAEMPDIHYLLPGMVDPCGVHDDEEALALTCFCIDEDAGLHAVLVFYSSGILRGVYVDEPDLLARDRGRSGRMGPAKSRASFQLQLSHAMSMRGLVSPATAPTPTHTIQLTTVGNICLLRVGPHEAFVVALPVWSREQGGWGYYSPPCGRPCRREVEAGRLGLAGLASEPPPPLAVRVPFAIAEASLALGETELVVLPEVAGPGTGGWDGRGVVLKVASVLQSALYAQAEDLRCEDGPGLPPLDRGQTTSSREGLRGELEGLLSSVAKCHREWLCGFPPDEVDLTTDNLVDDIEKTIKEVKREEDLLQVRETKLYARLEALNERVKMGMTRLNAWTDTLLDVIIHRRGPRSIIEANERLGAIHKMLCLYEKKNRHSCIVIRNNFSV
ncbi:unnamed protein product [Phytomonas sp. Hart1]|nr:unnamed protein product [Phytomonas sp. Hart1]|eukprot:CCW65935.1 unnamed protein product [Phytomonas sp. isolate Hart1]